MKGIKKPLCVWDECVCVCSCGCGCVWVCVGVCEYVWMRVGVGVGMCIEERERYYLLVRDENEGEFRGQATQGFGGTVRDLVKQNDIIRFKL